MNRKKDVLLLLYEVCDEKHETFQQFRQILSHLHFDHELIKDKHLGIPENHLKLQAY
jgi:hypothetical protein